MLTMLWLTETASASEWCRLRGTRLVWPPSWASVCSGASCSFGSGRSCSLSRIEHRELPFRRRVLTTPFFLKSSMNSCRLASVCVWRSEISLIQVGRVSARFEKACRVSLNADGDDMAGQQLSCCADSCVEIQSTN